MSSSRIGNNIRERTQLFSNARPYSQSPNESQNTPLEYTDAMLDHMESQNDEKVSALSSKISVLKDLSLKIGHEAKDTNALNALQEHFDNARVSVKNTMTRMIRTAARSGVNWKSWLYFSSIVILVFWVVAFLL